MITSISSARGPVSVSEQVDAGNELGSLGMSHAHLSRVRLQMRQIIGDSTLIPDLNRSADCAVVVSGQPSGMGSRRLLFHQLAATGAHRKRKAVHRKPVTQPHARSRNLGFDQATTNQHSEEHPLTKQGPPNKSMDSTRLARLIVHRLASRVPLIL